MLLACTIGLHIRYSRVPNKRSVSNKRPGWKIFLKLDKRPVSNGKLGVLGGLSLK